MVTPRFQSRTPLHAPVFVTESRCFLFPNGGIFKKRARRHNPSCFWESPTAKKKTAILTPKNRIIMPAPSADGDKPSAERTRPQGCISAPLVLKGFIRRSRFRLVFSDIPVPAHSSRQAGEARQLPRRSWSLLPAQCFQRLRPGR